MLPLYLIEPLIVHVLIYMSLICMELIFRFPMPPARQLLARGADSDHFLRNTYNMKIIAPAFRSAVAHFNWTRIAIITQNEGLFTGVSGTRGEQ